MASVPGIVLGLTLGVVALVPLAKGADPAPLYLEGYVDPVSVEPGDEVSLCVSTSAKQFDVEIARVGAEERVVWTKTGLSGREHPAGDGSGRPGQAAMEGCRWPAAVKFTVPDDWPSGFYRVVLSAEGQRRGEIPAGPFHRVMMTTQPPRFVMFFVVRAATRLSGNGDKILLQLASNTWLPAIKGLPEQPTSGRCTKSGR